LVSTDDPASGARDKRAGLLVRISPRNTSNLNS
jgi:hypothetical protein